MRIAIVNDVLMAVEALHRLLTSRTAHEIAWIARDGEQAVARCRRDLPDLILMDLVMPRMDGVEATRRIMAGSPCPIVIVTASVTDYPGKIFAALGAGALDAVNTPFVGGKASAQGQRQLLAKVETIHRLLAPLAPPKTVGRKAGFRSLPQHENIVCIGASAGGPAALARLLGGLPGSFPAAVVVAQHLDAQFAAGLAEWLGQHARLPVRLAEEGERLQPGVVYLAGRDHHLELSSPTQLGYRRAAADAIYRPSLDVLFASAARHCRGNAVGVVLTGMGRDGAQGLLAMRERGFLTLAQDQATSAVFGMPKAVIELQAAVEILALDKIAPRLVNVFAF